MRPMKLELEGFTLFRERSEIDFRCFDLFAITGQTGAGKTSLLDAMTYALYGKTSRLNKAGRDLISQGATDMSVSLWFRAGRDEYQVTRAIHGPTATARLDKLEQGKWHSVSGHAGEIGQRVERIIGLDFDAFTKWVILPQGKFDQFLQGSRKEQRGTLNDLLDMQVYQRMVQSANEEKNRAGGQLTAKEQGLDPAATGQAKAELERELAGLEAREERASDLVERMQLALPQALSLREKRRARQDTERELEKTRIRMADTETAAANARQERDRQRGVVGSLNHEIAALEYDGESHVRLAQIEQKAIQRRKLSGGIRRATSQQERRRNETGSRGDGGQSCRKSLAVVTARLGEAEKSRTSAKEAFSEMTLRHGSADAVQDAADELDRLPSADEIVELREALVRLEGRATAYRAEYEAAQRMVAEAEAELKWAETSYEHWIIRDRAAALRHDLKAGQPCPVCEQTVHVAPTPLDARDLTIARGRCDAAQTGRQKRCDCMAALRTEGDALPGRIDLARRQCEQLESAGESAACRASRILGTPVDGGAAGLLRALSARIRTAELAAIEAESGYARAQRDERSASQAFQDARHNLELIFSRIANLDDRGVSLGEQIAMLEKDLRAAPPLEEIASRLAFLSHAREKRADLEVSRSGREHELKQAEELAVRCAKDVEALQHIQIKCAMAIEKLDLQIAGLAEQVHGPCGSFNAPDSRDEDSHIDGALVASRKDLETVQALVQWCRFAIQSIEEKITRNQRLGEEIVRHRAEEALYRELATWLNAANFQQYLMSSAFERLAHEGSSHLKELSNGRYTFAYRDKGFQVIDQWNGDDARSVDTLSGGESFLASLSLALALAESLAELNLAGGGVALESLFLDEGFSTLDAESQSRVADALQVLQGGKRLIGVITHVQALADQMPARIEIERTLSGSRVRQANG